MPAQRLFAEYAETLQMTAFLRLRDALKLWFWPAAYSEAQPAATSGERCSEGRLRTSTKTMHPLMKRAWR
eukprot:14464628-Alexandrium_andersonii.AAC.1